jgi:hypothetical protein
MTSIEIINCDDKSLKKIKDAAQLAEAAIKRCCSCAERDRLKKIPKITIECAKWTRSPGSPPNDPEDCAVSVPRSAWIYVTPLGLDDPGCGCLEGTLMHEALHFAGRGKDAHNADGGIDDVTRCLPCGS